MSSTTRSARSTISGGPSGFTTIFQNAAEVEATGFELEALLRPARGVRLSGSIAYTDATYANYETLDPLNPVNIAGGTPYNAITNPDPTAFGAPGGGLIQLAGNRVRNTPEWAWALHGEEPSWTVARETTRAGAGQETRRNKARRPGRRAEVGCERRDRRRGDPGRRGREGRPPSGRDDGRTSDDAGRHCARLAAGDSPCRATAAAVDVGA